MASHISTSPDPVSKLHGEGNSAVCVLVRVGGLAESIAVSGLWAKIGSCQRREF